MINLYLKPLILFAILSLGFVSNAQVYVDIAATGTNNGTSWANAYTDLQDALDNAVSGNEIWVAEGTYLPLQEPDGAPTGVGNERYRAFHLANKDIVIYGGFIGNEALASQRDWIANPTILSGDFNGDDIISGGGATLSIVNNTENAYHVFVSHGLTNSFELNGFSILGGNADGTGASIVYTSQIIQSNVGGGFCNFTSSPTITNCNFNANSANFGGGLYLLQANAPIVTNVTFSENLANNNAGGLFAAGTITNPASPILSNLVFSENRALQNGGGLYLINTTATVMNCTFSQNEASSGGGINLFASSSTHISNISNSVFYDNTSAFANTNDIFGSVLIFNVSYCAFGNFAFGAAVGCFALTASPFTDINNPIGADNVWMTSDDGLSIGLSSSCLGTGTPTGAPSMDITGETRPTPPSIGAYDIAPPPVCIAATTLFVNINAGGLNDGTSWTDAFTDLQPALDCADAGDTIWVAAGTYLPTEIPDGAFGVSQRFQSFHVWNKNISIYGGFSGTETLLNQRNWLINSTILSGDFNGDDIMTGTGSTLSFTNYNDNATNIFVTFGQDSTSLFDGFSFKGGNADANTGFLFNGEFYTRGKGGGLYNKNSSPTLVNLEFSENYGNSAGGMYNQDGSSPNLSEVSFSLNKSLEGAGMGNYNNSDPIITDVIFTGNYSQGTCGAMHNNQSSPIISNTIFNENYAITSGGAIYNTQSSPILTNVTFTGNDAQNGGGMFNSSSDPILTNVVFSDNNASDFGGGIANFFSVASIYTNVTFSGNNALTSGGAIYNNSSSPTLTNTLFYGNISPNQKDIVNISSSATVEYCAFEDYVYGAALGCFTLTANPFINAADLDGVDNIWMTADDGLVLSAGSPPVGTGTATGAPSTDITGTTRPNPPSIGAYEGLPALCQAATRLYVNINAGGINDGTSWANGFLDLQPALDCADDGDTIWVAAGTYLPTEEPDGAPTGVGNERYKAFHLANKDVVVYGGFIGNETLASQRDWQANPVILSGDFLGDDIVTGVGSSLSISNNTENAYHVFVMVGLNTAAELDGFRIIGGNANNGSTSFDYGSVGATIFADEGGGLNNSFNSSPTLSNLIITHNNAASNGGGMYNNSSSSPVINNATLAENISANGGGMYNLSLSQVVLTNVVFSGNRALAAGGMRNQGSSPILTNVTFSANHGLNSGGAIRNTGSSPVLTNILFYGNTSNNQKDIFNNSATPVVSYSAFEDYVFGAAVGCLTLTASPFINAADSDGADNIWMTADDGLVVASGSPPVGAGIAAGAPTLDIIGTTRPNPPSIGAYEGDATCATAACVNSVGNSGNFGFSISNVTLNDINNSSPTTTNGYDDFTCTNTTCLTPGDTYNLSIDVQSGHPTQVAEYRVYIDYNDNGDFTDLGEEIMNGTVPANSGVVSINQNILIPTTAVQNVFLRMRVINDQVSVSGPCETMFTGSSEDYGVYISAATGTDTQVACDSFTWTNGITYLASNTSAMDTFINAAGCDSIVTLDLTINNSNSTTDTRIECDSLIWIDGITYTASTNTSTFTLTNAANCDSIVTLDLTINTFTGITDVQTACDSLTWIDGLTYTTSTNSPTFTLNNPSGCDTIVTLDLTINYSNTGTDTQVACDSLTWIDGSTYYASTNTPTFALTNTAGCDSIVTLDLTINNSNSSTDTQVACDSLTWIDGITYTNSTNTPTFTSTNVAGCDSVVILNLTINNSNSTTDTRIECDSLIWIDGITYTASTNTPTFTLTNAANCDSIITLDLTINSFTGITDVRTACDSLTWIDGLTYTASTNSPTFTLNNPSGCDTIVTLDLTINYSNTGTDTQTACDSLTWIDGVTYTSSTNTPTFTMTNTEGCDSIVTLDVSINNSNTGTDTQTVCDSLTWIDGITYTASTNTPTFTLTNAAGCDSIVTLDLIITTFTTSTDTHIVCDSLSWIDGNTYSSSTNTPTFTITNASGCDSIVTLDLTVNSTTASTDTQIACDSLTWLDGITYTTSTNTPTFNLTNAANCDSIVTLNLTINNSSSGTDTLTACDSLTWIDGNTYTNSANTPTFTLTNAAGCDSVITLNLIINNSNTGTDTQTACDSLTWIDGNTYTSSTNTPTFTLTNTANCDSVVTLNLTINNSNSGTDTQTTCDSLTWIDGVTYTNSTSTPTFTLTNAANCDSVVTLNLTINNSNTGIDARTACDSLTWIDGITYTNSTNTPTFNFANGAANGCDSLVTLDLTINNSSIGTDTQAACDSLTWIDGITYTNSTNTPSFTLTNAAGCDSVITLNLTINNSNTGTDTQTACDSLTWIDGFTYINSTSTPTFTLTNAANCDSVVTLNLTINNSNIGTDVQTTCDSLTWIDGITYTSSTSTPTFTLTNAAACDSVVTLNLTINNSNAGIDVQTACDAFTWIDGNTYTANNNTATHLVTNTAGCDSLVTLDLTVNYTSFGTDVQTACDSFTWINGITYVSPTNNPTFNIAGGAANGCDSIVTLNLSMNYTQGHTYVLTACDSLTWINGITYTSSIINEIFIVPGATASGCDSIYVLDLTIIPSGSGTDIITACDSYTWIDGITYTSSTNMPMYTVQGGNTNGCDAEMSLDLTILASPTIVITQNNGIYEATPGLSNYQWYRNGQLLVGETNSTHMPSLYGGYTCTTSNASCTGISNMIVRGVTGIGLFEFETISIYPNPAQDYLNIEIAQEKVTSIKLFDISGKLIRDLDIQQTQFYMGEFASGMYFIELANEEKRSLVKIVLK